MKKNIMTELLEMKPDEIKTAILFAESYLKFSDEGDAAIVRGLKHGINYVNGKTQEKNIQDVMRKVTRI